MIVSMAKFGQDTQTAPFIINPVNVRFDYSLPSNFGKFDQCKTDIF